MATPWIQSGLHPGPVDAAQIPLQPGCGGECVFLGRTRAETHPEHGELLRLDYEAYTEMAEKGLRDLAERIAREHGCHAVRIVHAVGEVPVGAASVAIQTLAPHRPEAFAACRMAIDLLKQEIPIWKKEIWQKGKMSYVEGDIVKRF